MIYQKILNIMQAVQYLKKDDSVEFKSTKYKAISEEKVTTTVRAEMIKQGLVIFPVKQDWIHYTTAGERPSDITHVDVTYKLVDVETGEEIEIASCGDGADTQDKGPGKAMTYAFKYALLRTFAIPTGEDPDKISSAELDAMRDAQFDELEQISKDLSEACKCEVCGKQISAKIANRSLQVFGKVYCSKKCADKAGAVPLGGANG